MSALLAYVHTLAMIAMGAMLYMLMLGFDKLDAREGVLRFVGFARRVALAAVIMLASGIALVLLSAHGMSYYIRNPVFWIKVAVFVAMVLIAITPARIIMLWGREIDQGKLPDPAAAAFLRRYVTIEGVLFVLLPLAASLAARGIGLQMSSS